MSSKGKLKQILINQRHIRGTVKVVCDYFETLINLNKRICYFVVV